mgnify:CR=1 FL=1
MKITENTKPYKRIAIVFSLCMLIIWAILGTGASVAWFTDTSPEINNIFHIADFELEVTHRLPDGTWEKVDGQTKIFDDEALYEPGYVQVVYLKAENKGDREFKFKTAVNVNGCIMATNVFQQQFALQDYLKFGLVTSFTEEEMDNLVLDREKTVEIANMPLHNYYETGSAVLNPGKSAYIAIVVRMPEEVGNVANYRGETVPEVELGITVRADQVEAQ